MNVSWKNELVPAVLYFNDLKVGESFKIDTYASQGAIYTKVDVTKYLDEACVCQLGKSYASLEIATGKVFPPTKSPIKRVSVSVSIDEVKPALYS